MNEQVEALDHSIISLIGGSLVELHELLYINKIIKYNI